MYLYIGINGRVAAIDPQTGREVWRAWTLPRSPNDAEGLEGSRYL